MVLAKMTDSSNSVLESLKSLVDSAKDSGHTEEILKVLKETHDNIQQKLETPVKISEPLLEEPENRYALLPIKNQAMWDQYQACVACFWVPEEIDLKQDLNHWAKLSADEKHFITHILAFFASSDFIINENLVERFMQEVKLPEAQLFYGFQIAMEGIHSVSYSLLLDSYVTDKKLKDKCLNAIQTIPCVAKKANWAKKWTHDRVSNFAKRVVCFAIVEGVFFSGSFCAVFWLKHRGLMPGLCFSNELISRDEGMHTDFACLMYSMLNNKLSEEEIYAIMDEALVIEKEFIIDALPCKLIGMSSPQMSQYLEFVADRLLVQLGYKKKYMSRCPFSWLESISLEGKQSMFEGRNSSYSKAHVGTSKEDQEFGLDADF